MYYDTCREINDADIIDYVKINYSPSEVFSEDMLNEWALNNGFVKECE